jgi:predicted dehydrogenase
VITPLDTIAGATGHRPRVYSDYGTLFANHAPDAVSLGLPPSANPEVARAALEAGCPVIAEKPIAANLNDAREMVSWGERYGRVLMIAENWRYYGGFQRAVRRSRTSDWPPAGALGPLFCHVRALRDRRRNCSIRAAT